ncbi:hypothetical protein EI546_03640 [Aequorivita sp. H23M31]|uniref:PD-(D/E)XK nuclease family protein n=1 Tax=Aequorivita ciconiae TaxID=2494375 RepID=A0A410G0S3_9FLAO|nr:PD-(D/E)XK nuclease family protein [Aequorivita sp. H23M31]QAA80876.1 hypothetical protein EI546_03640 [Aequorivita sp. H23M31]
MFNNLYKLYRNNNSQHTPLEDFNTECFAGILNCYPEILNSFVVDFLDLPLGAYNVSTQLYYPLSEDPNCIVDMVLESDNCICFIENKVNSVEGFEQLERYKKVLESFKGEKETVLRYITKWSDVKINISPRFKQYRWYEIADWLQREFAENVLVTNYYNFLKSQNMARKKEITTDGVIALKNFYDAYSTAILHLESGQKIFQNYFPKTLTHGHNFQSYKRIIEGHRVYYIISDLFKEHKNYHSEILLAFHIRDVTFQLQLWLSLTHPLGPKILERVSVLKDFDVANKNEHGFMINRNIKLYNFIDAEDVDGEIKKWFTSGFDVIRNFIDDNPDLNWDAKVLR